MRIQQVNVICFQVVDQTETELLIASSQLLQIKDMFRENEAESDSFM